MMKADAKIVGIISSNFGNLISKNSLLNNMCQIKITKKKRKRLLYLLLHVKNARKKSKRIPRFARNALSRLDPSK